MSLMAEDLYCEWCSYCCKLQLDLIKHSFEAHSIESTFHFKCSIGGCLHHFNMGTTFFSFKSHADRKHPHWRETIQNSRTPAPAPAPAPAPDNGIIPAPDSEPQQEQTPMMDSEHQTMQQRVNELHPAIDFVHRKPNPPSAKHTAALFLLALHEKYRLSQSAINFAVGSVSSIVESVCNTIEVTSQSASSSLTLIDPFSGLQTEHQQSKFYREEFGLVEPLTVELGTSYKYSRSSVKRSLIESKDTFQYVPLIENLKWLLHNQDIYNEVFKERPQNHSHYLYDFCDGQFFKDHPVFSVNPHALQIIVYYDDVETANALGSYRGCHKLGMFYYFLGNIDPKLRSVLKCTQLIACVSVPNLEKYGFENVLKPFIEDANKLAEGISISIHGEQKFIIGQVLYLLADTQAAHDIGGFKVGVGFSLRKCRECMATGEQISTKFKSNEFIPRTPGTYNYHCSLLNGPLHRETSTTYGINYCSPLHKLTNFHVVNQMPQDIMHVLLEGVVPYELTLMLTNFISIQKYFSCDLLNDRIFSFSYSTHEAKDKPSPIRPQIFTSAGGTLSQTSAQMWALAINLPLMIGDKVPTTDEKWECYLLLLDILQLCTTRVASSAQAGYLEALISDHHQLFIRCYPGVSITPKMHYMIHFPQQIVRTGPLIGTWCMRMEGKNAVAKQAARTSNFKNVPFTVAKRHQRLLCVHLQGKNFFDHSVQYGPAKEAKQLHKEEDSVIAKAGPYFSMETLVHRLKWCVKYGAKYSKQEYLLIGWQEDDLPLFGRIQDILSINNHVLFSVLNYKTMGIDHHFHSYSIEKTESQGVLWLSEVVDYHALQAHQLSNHNLYITLRSHIEKFF